MQQVKDTVSIILFIVWICVGIGLLLFLYNNYDLSQMARPGGGGPGGQMMQQYPGGSGAGYGLGQGNGSQNGPKDQNDKEPANTKLPPNTTNPN